MRRTIPTTPLLLAILASPLMAEERPRPAPDLPPDLAQAIDVVLVTYQAYCLSGYDTACSALTTLQSETARLLAAHHLCATGQDATACAFRDAAAAQMDEAHASLVDAMMPDDAPYPANPLGPTPAARLAALAAMAAKRPPGDFARSPAIGTAHEAFMSSLFD